MAALIFKNDRFFLLFAALRAAGAKRLRRFLFNKTYYEVEIPKIGAGAQSAISNFFFDLSFLREQDFWASLSQE